MYLYQLKGLIDIIEERYGLGVMIIGQSPGKIILGCEKNLNDIENIGRPPVLKRVGYIDLEKEAVVFEDGDSNANPT